MRNPLSRYVRTIGLLLGGCLVFAVAACDRSTSSAAPPTSQSSAGAGAKLADGQLAGLYVRQRMIPLAIGGRMTFSLARDFFYFFPDGHVLFGVPPAAGLKEHPTAADFAAFKDVDPTIRGTYAVKGNTITFTPAKGEPSTEPFSIPKAGDDSVLQIGPASVVGSVKALPFKDGEKLDGSYQYDGTIGLGGANTVYNVNTLTFHPDGTLASDQLSGVDTRGKETAAGSSGVTTHSQTASAGTYKLSGYTLETTVGGKTEQQTAFRWAGDDKPAIPGLLCIAGRVYSRQEAKK